MRLRNITLAVMLLLMLAFSAGMAGASNQTNATVNGAENQTSIAANNKNMDEQADDVAPYEGSIGPGSSLYGLKIAFEGLDETFTFNKSEKIGKKVAHARQRIAEAKTELKNKNDEAAVRALEKYREKIKEADEAVSEASDEDTGLLNAQKMSAKHEAVLKALLESHPDNKGLARAYNNSVDLQEKFESKTGRGFVLATRNGREVLEEIDIDETKEKLKIKAKIIDKTTQVEVEVKFTSNSADNFTIAREIVNRLQLSEENINSIIKVEEEDEGEHKLKEELNAEAEVKGNISKVEAEYKFPLNETNESEIVRDVHQKLSVLTQADVLKVLEIKVKKEHNEIGEKENKNGNKGQEEIGEKENKNEKKGQEEIAEKENKSEKKGQEEIAGKSEKREKKE